MKKTIATAVVIVLAGSLAIAAPNGGKGGRHGKRGFGFSEKMAEKLDLTDTQKQQIRDLQASFREQNKAFFESARETREEFRAAKEANDTAKLEALKPALQSQHAQMKQLRDAQHQRVLSILTADQRAKLEAMKAERGNRRF